MTQHKMAREVKRCQITDLAQVNGAMPPGFLETINEYLGHFCKPVREGENLHQVCPKCGQEINGFRAMVGLGVGLEWDLAHGEAHCTGCRWPYRGLHVIRERDAKPGDRALIEISGLFLAYHPDDVEVRSTADKIKEALRG